MQCHQVLSLLWILTCAPSSTAHVLLGLAAIKQILNQVDWLYVVY